MGTHLENNRYGSSINGWGNDIRQSVYLKSEFAERVSVSVDHSYTLAVSIVIALKATSRNCCKEHTTHSSKQRRWKETGH